MLIAFLIVLSLATAPVVLGWGYFRRYAVTRPPIGVVSLGDVAVMVVAIVLVPYLYLALPRSVVAGLLAAVMLSALGFTLEPVLRHRWAVWGVALLLVGADIAATVAHRAQSPLALAVNDLVLVLAIVGVANLWAQSGLRARDASLLAAFLVAYDAVATGYQPLTGDLVRRLADLPFAPLLAWGTGDGHWLAIGLGDLLLATVFPLVLRKAFGRTAGLLALGLCLGTIGTLLALSVMGHLTGTSFPVMVVLGPLLVAQYAAWAWRRGRERTTWQYLQGEGLSPG